MSIQRSEEDLKQRTAVTDVVLAREDTIINILPHLKIRNQDWGALEEAGQVIEMLQALHLEERRSDQPTNTDRRAHGKV